MSKYPQHRISEISDIGIGFLQISSGQAIKVPVTYKHQDDYYMFGFVESGTCRLHVDFQDYELKGGEAMFLLPGQVHAFDEQSLVKYMFSHRLPLVLDSVHGQELKQLYSMLANRMKNSASRFPDMSRWIWHWPSCMSLRRQPLWAVTTELCGIAMLPIPCIF
mgnify:CR=1 FL=1|jgi:hypothetical protein